MRFARDGTFLCVVDSAGERVLLYAREGESFGRTPAWTLAGAESGLADPHDADVSPDGRWLVVASRRRRSLAGHRRSGDAVRFSKQPRWRLLERGTGGPYGAVRYAPHGRALAASSLGRHRVALFERALFSRFGFRRRPTATIEGPGCGLARPSGLAFTPDGALLAVANPQRGTVTLYPRVGDGYGNVPATTLSGFAVPHSLEFSPDGTLLAVAAARARAVALLRRASSEPGSAWSRVDELDASPPASAPSPGDDGPKGVAFGLGCLACCSPKIGVRVHRIRERAPDVGDEPRPPVASAAPRERR